VVVRAHLSLRGGMIAAVTVVSLCSGAAEASASSVSLCVPSGAGQPLLSGACSSGGTTVKLPASATDQNTLLAVLPHMSFLAAGVGGKPTIRFSGVNFQLVSGSGATNSAVNGEGNLVLGYDESPGTQTGSHNLVLGVGQAFASYGAILGG